MELTEREDNNTLSESEISMLLDTYMYLNYYDAHEGQRLEDILQDISGLPDYRAGGIHEHEYHILRQAVDQNFRLGQMQISAQSHQLGFDSGTKACLFLEEDSDTVYVVYRGTGDGEWMDNGLGMTMESTPLQAQAVSYFETAMDDGSYTEDYRIIITGHSKGGNKAQFVTMESTYGYLIDKCISVDGQGFSETAIEAWQHRYTDSEYAARTEKLYGINGENDFVHVLGYGVIPNEHISYLQTPTEDRNFTGYHDIKYMFAEDRQGRVVFHGRSNDITTGLKEWGLFARRLSAEMFTLPPKERAGCAAVIMQLMELGGEQKTGQYGEKATLDNWADFFREGVPMVVSSYLLSEEGRGLERLLQRGENVAAVIYRVHPSCLIREAQQIEITALWVRRIMEEVEQVEEALKRSINSIFYPFGIGSGIKKIRINLLIEAEQLIKMSEALIFTAQAYYDCERMTADN